MKSRPSSMREPVISFSNNSVTVREPVSLSFFVAHAVLQICEKDVYVCERIFVTVWRR